MRFKNFKRSSGWARVGDLAVRKRFTVCFDETDFEEEHPVDIDVRIVGGAPVVDALTIRRNEALPTITSTDLRRLPLTRLVHEAMQQLAHEIAHVEDGSAVRFTPRATESALPPLAKRTSVTPDRLERVAAAWREGEQLRRGTRRVAEVLSVHPRQAARLVAKARAAGLIPPRGDEDGSR